MKTNTSQTVEFTVEIEETVVIRGHRRVVLQWCPECGRDERMATPENAAAIAGVSTRRIYSGVEDQTIHFSQFADGSLKVCLGSFDQSRFGSYSKD
jgi:hypothetical protein